MSFMIKRVVTCLVSPYFGVTYLALQWIAIGACPLPAAEEPESPATVDSGAIKNLEAFPQPPEGRVRKVILLPHKERGSEEDFQVELVVGRTIETDGINSYSFAGRLVSREVEGWGFTYQEVEGDLKQAASTRMSGDSKPAMRFVAGPRTVVAYNSRLPIVVMVPAGCELRWRVWRADTTFHTAEAR